MHVWKRLKKDRKLASVAIALGLLTALLLTFPLLVQGREQLPNARNSRPLAQYVLAPVLTISKVATPDPAQAGAILTYTIEYGISNEPAQGVVITDRVPANTSFKSCTPAPCEPVDGLVRWWHTGTVTPGTYEVTLVVSVNSPLPNGTVLTNCAGITAQDALTESVEITTTVESQHAFTLKKTASPDPVQAGALLTYSIVYTVTGNEAAPNAVITDPVPENTAYADCWPKPCGEASDVVSWTLHTIPPGSGQVVLTVTVTSPLTDGTVLTNTAYIDDDEAEPISSTVTTTVQSNHTLILDKSASSDRVAAGEVLTYSIVYTVTGNEAAPNAVITDPVPANTAYVGCSPEPCGEEGDVVSWTLHTIPPGSGQVTLVVTVTSPLTDGTVLTNTAYIDDDEAEPISSTVTTTVQSNHTLDLDKSARSDRVAAGEVLTYSIIYTVTGNEAAPNAIITDPVPENTTYASCSPEPCREEGGVVSWTLHTIPPGSGQVVLTVTVTSPLTDGTILTNTAQISDADGETASSTVTAIVASPDLVVTKTVVPAIVLPLGSVRYVITVTNLGGGTATDVEVFDVLAPGFQPPDQMWTIPSLSNAEVWTETLDATAPQGEGIYSNVVTVTWQVGNQRHEAGTGPTAPVIVDGTEPESTILSLPDITNHSPISITWQAGDQEPGSGLAETCLWYKLEGGTNWAVSTLCQTTISGTFGFVPPSTLSGTFHFQTVATDQLGNAEPQPQGDSEHQTLYDPQIPESTAQSPATVPPHTTIDVTWTATDTLSGVDSVVLWVRRGKNGTWQQSGLSADHLAGSPVTGTFKFIPTQTRVIYYFETVATDIASNQEPRVGGDGATETEVTAYLVYLPVVLRAYVPPSPNLSDSTKTADRAFVDPGDVIVYTIELHNSGQVAADFTLRDRIPDQTTLVAVDAPCSPGSNSVDWSGTLAPGSSGQCQFSVRVEPDAAGTILNTAVLTDGYHAESVPLTATVDILSWHPGQGFPPGTTIYSIVPCPGCDTLYAGTRNHGVWKSEDGGASWDQLGLVEDIVRSVSVAPNSDCGIIYATTWGSGVWKYANEEWSPVNNDLGDLYLYSVVSVNATTVYAGTSSAGVYKSQDGGASWTPINDGLPQNALVYALAYSASDPPTLYAGTWGGVYKIENGETSWSPLNAGLAEPRNITALAIHPTDPTIMYAATEQHGVYRWEADAWVNEWGGGDGGNSGSIAYTVAVDQESVAYLGTDGDKGGIWRKIIGGAWQLMPTQPGTNLTIRAIAIPSPACTPDRLLWLGTADGAWWYGGE
ncbi:MAG: DUF11 domain-containing protein [Anaerolineae bacterium]|nr:DUF11 domain-containing protein [Anaerolineae bacterium]